MTPSAPAITEPMTMATDYLLAILALVLAASIRKRAGSWRDRPTRAWFSAFLVAALAAIAGGTAHGFRLYLAEAGHAALWRVTVVSIGLTALLMLVAGVHSARHPTTARAASRRTGHGWLKWGLAVSLAGVLVQRSGWSIHEHLNHNDIYHLIQMLGFVCFYRGASLLHDWVSPT